MLPPVTPDRIRLYNIAPAAATPVRLGTNRELRWRHGRAKCSDAALGTVPASERNIYIYLGMLRF